MQTDRLVLEQVQKYFYRKKIQQRSFPQSLFPFLQTEKETIKAVDDISFEVQLGQIYGVLGANGSGKSTLIRLISSLLLPVSGQITIFGYDVVKNSYQVRKMMNRVSVDAAFFKRLSALENLIYTARLYDIPVKTATTKATEILERLGFKADRMNGGMEDLSRGMQQKVAIARAFLTTPILLLLDEPTTGLDPKSKRDVQAFINEIRKEHETAIILTTHDMAEAETLCDEIAIIDQGKFIARGTASQLKSQINKPESTLEEVFIELTGKDLQEE